MIRSSTRSLATLASILLSTFAVACGSQVSGGGNGDGGSGDGDGGSGGAGGGKDECTVGQGEGCMTNAGSGFRYCVLVDNAPTWGACQVSSSMSTPLVLSFASTPVDFFANDGHTFDLSGTTSAATDWPSATTPWLAIDKNGNGQIDDGSELFGSASVLSTGERATNGFIALRELDTNHDGTIDAQDPGFSKLLIWSDRDGDRLSSKGELEPAAAKLVSIDLAYRNEPRCDARGNCEIERASFRFVGEGGSVRTGTIVDVHLKWQ